MHAARTAVEELGSRVAALLPGSPAADSVSLRPLGASGNNRVFEVDAPGARYVAKHYYSSRDDVRDRLAAEWGLLDYAERVEAMVAELREVQSFMAELDQRRGEPGG